MFMYYNQYFTLFRNSTFHLVPEFHIKYALHNTPDFTQYMNFIFHTFQFFIHSTPDKNFIFHTCLRYYI